MEHRCMVMTLRLSSSRCSGSHQIHCGRKNRVKFAAMLIPGWSSIFRHPMHCPQGIHTPWSNRQCQILLWGFEAAEGGHSAQMSRQVEEQLVSPPWPPWQCARSRTTRGSIIPDFQKHYMIPNPLPPAYSPDLAPCNFLLLPKMKLRLKGRRFDTTEEIHAESQEVIDTLTFENFQGWMKSWETRWDRCIHAQGDYFEGNSGK